MIVHLFGRELPTWSPYVLFALHVCLFVILVVSHFGFEGRTLILVAPLPGSCSPFTFNQAP